MIYKYHRNHGNGPSFHHFTSTSSRHLHLWASSEWSIAQSLTGYFWVLSFCPISIEYGRETEHLTSLDEFSIPGTRGPRPKDHGKWWHRFALACAHFIWYRTVTGPVLGGIEQKNPIPGQFRGTRWNSVILHNCPFKRNMSISCPCLI